LNSTKTCFFIAIGSELLSGDVLESNAHWLQNKLKHTHLEMTRIEVLEDKLDTIVSAIKSALGKVDYLIVCGGLGPTDDDLTREAVSRACERPLWFNSDSWKFIQAIFAQRQKKAGKSNERQAFQPEGSRVLENPIGTAPGFELTLNGTCIMTYPGVPSEYFKMIEMHLLPRLEAQTLPAHFKLWGIGESDLSDQIHQAQLIPPDLAWGTIARKEGLSLRLYPESLSHPLYQVTCSKLREHFKDYIYTESALQPVELLAAAAATIGFKIALAESCTGGMLAELFTRIPGCSAYFQGSIVAYQNSVKQSLLHVSEKILRNHGAVSPECVEAMALGCQKQLNAQLGLAVSGIAGPDGGTATKPVGTVYIAASYHDNTRSKLLKLHGSRQDIRERSCYALCLLALTLIKETHA